MDSVACLPVTSYSKSEIFFSPFIYLTDHLQHMHIAVSELLAHTLIRKLSTVFP